VTYDEKDRDSGYGLTEVQSARAKEAVKELGIKVEVIKVKDIKTITGYGVMITPALVVDGVVKAAGKVPKVEQIKEWIK
jgi:small redox-active disulfide protein 2